MKSQELLEVIGEAQDEYILDARESKQKGTPAWKKWTALAACICLILGAVWIFRPVTGHYPNAHYSAYDIADLFPQMLESGTTNAYTEVCVPSSEYLQLNPIPEADTLPIYRYDYSRLTTASYNKRKAFVEKTLTNYCAALGIPVPEYQLSADDSRWKIVTPDEYYRFLASSYSGRISFQLSVTNQADDPTIYLNGHAVQVDQRQTDQEILASLEEVKSQLFEIYGVSFSDTKILRFYDGYGQTGVDALIIYFYDADGYPLNAFSSEPLSDHIRIYFDNVPNFDGDFVSSTILSKAEIKYVGYTMSPKQLYPQIAKENMISLAEAEKMLYKGYVFGGHSCPLCMAEQEEISFEDYDYVGLEYVFGVGEEGRKYRDVVPFYAFYKAIGTSENGDMIFAKTYVPAIEVSDLEAYFRDQKQSHKSRPTEPTQ
jgi:hypothetical protein